MAIALYTDQHVPRAITTGLRLREVDVITAYEDGANRRQRDGIPFAGVVYAHQFRASIGACVDDLELIARAGEPKDLSNRVEFLPL